jgi:GNAT superfamily N-acetyltransferase
MLRLKDYLWTCKAWQLADGKWRDHSVPGDVNSPIVEVQAPGQDSGKAEQASEFSSVSDDIELDNYIDEVSGWDRDESGHEASAALSEAARIGSNPTVGKDARGKVNSVMLLDEKTDPIELRHIAVRTDEQGKGIAKRLMVAAAKKALSSNKDISLKSVNNRVSFYEHIGAHATGKAGQKTTPMLWPKDKMKEFIERESSMHKNYNDIEDPVGVLATVEMTPEQTAAHDKFFALRKGMSKDARVKLLKDLRAGFSDKPEVDAIIKSMY